MTDTPVVLLKTLPMNEARSFSFGGREVVLCRTPEGVCALDGICTHEDLPLDGGEVVDQARITSDGHVQVEIR